MNATRVKIITTVPPEAADKVREAMGKAGAGTIGNYRYCSFSVTGTGRFLPTKDANPHIGTPGQFEKVTEERVEVVCNRSDAKNVIAALKTAHPYEEVIIDIVPLLDEDLL
jgi:hypothetical protein